MKKKMNSLKEKCTKKQDIRKNLKWKENKKRNENAEVLNKMKQKF